MSAAADPDGATKLQGTDEELRARAVDLARQGALPVEAMVEVAQSTDPTGEVLERVIKASGERRPANWAARAARAASTVCRVSVDKRPVGTGFLVSADLVLTTHHVLPDMAAAGRAIVDFTVEADTAEGPYHAAQYELAPAAFFVTDERLDYTLVRAEASSGDRPGDRFGWNRLDGGAGKILVGEPVNLVGHHGGGEKEIQTSGALLLDVAEDVLRYTVDSEPGSAGSPVFNDQWEVVAVHHAAVRPDRPATATEQVGEGVRVSAILAHLAGLPDDAGRSVLAELDQRSRRATRSATSDSPAQSVETSTTPDGSIGVDGAARVAGVAGEPAHGPADLQGLISELVGDNPLVARLVAAAQRHPEQYPDAESVRRGLTELIAAAWAGLEPDAVVLLRRVSLVADDGIEPRIAAYLTGTEPPAATSRLQELVAAGLLLEGSDGHLYFVHDTVREYARQQFDQSEPPEEQDAARHVVNRWRSGRQQPDRRLARDYWTTDDELHHTPYAHAIASFIQHPQTRPPLTIGIKAPWGAGKTSLMRMVQKRLDPSVDESPLGAGAAGPRKPRPIELTDVSRKRVSGRTGGERARRPLPGTRRGSDPAPDDPVRVAEALHRANVAADDLPPADVRATLAGEVDGLRAEDWRATVWFNPWMYQSGEQVWAGLVHEIITQITDRLPVGDGERFWLRLNLARLDREALRRRTYRALVLRVLPFVVVALVATLIAAIALIFAELTTAAWLRTAGAALVSAGTGIGVIGAVVRALGFFGQAAAVPFGSLVRGPDVMGRARTALATEMQGAFDTVLPDPAYGSRVGFLYLVQTDVKRVLDLVATEDRPVVVFIDDLDRCSPGTVGQVMEAVNLFLAGEFPNCIFVIAMEPSVVAAHIEVAHRDLVEVTRGEAATRGSSLGWRFLEKIVQLPLSLPAARDRGALDTYARGLLGLGRETPPGAPPPTPGRPAAEAAPQAHGQPAELPARTPPPAGPTPDGAGARPAGRVVSGRSPAYPEVPDRELTRRLEDAIRARRPTIRQLPDVARQVQAELIPGSTSEPRPETAAAVDLIFRDLYRDEDAADALASALPKLGATTPREVKRYLNLFRFYTFIVQRQQLGGLDTPSPEQIAKLAALAIRWPRLVSSLIEASTDGEQPLAALEEASRAASSGAGWTQTMVQYAGVTLGDGGTVPAWCEDVREFLASGPRIGELSGRLL